MTNQVQTAPVIEEQVKAPTVAQNHNEQIDWQSSLKLTETIWETYENTKSVIDKKTRKNNLVESMLKRNDVKSLFSEKTIFGLKSTINRIIQDPISHLEGISIGDKVDFKYRVKQVLILGLGEDISGIDMNWKNVGKLPDSVTGLIDWVLTEINHSSPSSLSPHKIPAHSQHREH